MESVALASASPRRRELLVSLGLSVTVLPSTYIERPQVGLRPYETALFHARGKLAGAAASALITIAADTVVDLDGAELGKPRDDAHARSMLHALSGREHRVHTALALRDVEGTMRYLDVHTTVVRFATLDDAMINAYVASGDGRDKAGSYGIQGFAATLIERIEGDYFTVVGFPIGAFARALPALGVTVTPRPFAPRAEAVLR